MADGQFPSLVSADRNPNTLSNQMFMQITDGTNGASVDGSGNLQVVLAANSGVDIGDVDVTSVVPGTGAAELGKAVDSIAGGTDTGVLSLAVRDDVLTTLTVADGDYAQLRVNDEGALWIAGNITASPESVFIDDAAFTVAVSEVTAIGGIATSDSVDAGDVGAFRMLLNRALVTTLEDANGDGIAVDASGNLAIDIAAQSLTAVAVSADNNANNSGNPIFVNVTNFGASAGEIHDFDTATVASDATSNHDYTVVNAEMSTKKVVVSSSGAAKFEVQAGPIAALVTVAVLFIPKKGGTDCLDLSSVPLLTPVAATGTVRVIRTNREGSSQDLYSTIIGNDE